MFCARCGAINSDTVYLCRKCGASLQEQTGSSAASQHFSASWAEQSQGVPRLPIEQQPTLHAAGSANTSWFKPIPHSPFSEEPLPQPTGSMSVMIRPSGDVRAFVPGQSFSHDPFGEEPLFHPSGALPAVTRPSDELQAFMPGQPFPRNPFGEEPLPDPSGSMPAVILPTGEIQAFAHGFSPGTVPFSAPSGNTPAKSSSVLLSHLNQDIAEYPTQSDMAFSPDFSAGANTPGSPELPMPFSQQSFSAPAASTPTGRRVELEKKSNPSQALVLPEPANAFSPVLPTVADMDWPQGQHTVSSSVESKLIQPLPAWIFGLCTLGIALLLAAFIFLNPDWASGAMVAGIVAIIVACLILIALGVRVALGLWSHKNPHRRVQMLCATVPVLLLFLSSGLGITQQMALHATQAHFLENQQSWQMAINEYQAAGDSAPASTNLARVYNEWGQKLNQQHQYTSAVAKFMTVLTTYNQVPAQISLAKSNIVKAYSSSGNAALQRQDYAHATQYYDTLLSLDYCSSSCQSQAQSEDAAAYYHLAEQQLAAQQFPAAVNAFGTLTTRFARFPQAAEVHADYAKALWGQGQQQLGPGCSTAVKTYQQLAQNFSDTSQGQQAVTALKQPVNVSGRFTQAVPGAPFTPTAMLVQGLFVGIQQYQFPPLIANAPTTQINSDGTFTFSSVPQGTYELVWSDDGRLHFYYAFSGNQILYTAVLGPLCPYSYGNINAAIPTN